MASSAYQTMGIGSLGNATLKRKFRWLFEVFNIGGQPNKNISASFVKVANRPQLEVEETELNFLNGKTWIPGKATFQQLSVTYYDVVATDAESVNSVDSLFQWVNRVYNFTPKGNTGLIPATQGNSPTDYCGLGKLTMLDGGGSPVEQWRLVNCWPVSINFGDLDYSSSEESTIELNLRYSYAIYDTCVKLSDFPTPKACASFANSY